MRAEEVWQPCEHSIHHGDGPLATVVIVTLREGFCFERCADCARRAVDPLGHEPASEALAALPGADRRDGGRDLRPSRIGVAAP